MNSGTPVPLSFVCAQPEGGCTDEPPTIFLHGVTASKLHWTDIPQRVANATKRKAYVVDARNHGDSEWSDEFNFDINVDDLLHFMDYIGAPKAVLVGHSMGGITAIKTALRVPERVDKIVVEDMYTKKVPRDTMDMVLHFVALTNEAIDQVPADVDERTAKNIIGEYVMKAFPQDPNRKTAKEWDPQAAFNVKRGSDGRFRHSANNAVLESAMADYDSFMSESRGEYKGPAAFIYGETSPFLVGKEADDIRNHFPNAEFYEIEEADHDVHEEFKDEFVKHLTDFLLKQRN